MCTSNHNHGSLIILSSCTFLIIGYSIREGMITTGDLLYSVLLPLAQCKANNLPDSDGKRQRNN